MTVNHFAIRRDARARADEDQVALFQRGDGDGLGHVAVMDAFRRIGHEFGKFVERARGLTHRTHLQPVTEQHDIDQRDQFPEEAFAEIDELRRDAVHERDRDRQRDERHHAGLAIFQFRDCHVEEWNSSIGKDDDRKDEGNPFTERERRRSETEPHLDHFTVDQHGDAQEQTPPEADAEHLLVPCVIRVGGVRAVTLMGIVCGMSFVHAMLKMTVMLGMVM
jgi:hypothetical protein